MERDNGVFIWWMNFMHFNSHAHVERDDSKLIIINIYKNISTHTLTWSVTFIATFCRFCYLFQLTRSRGAWLCRLVWYTIYRVISTHTLTWSVTSDKDGKPRIKKISTHTLTWSVTWINKYNENCINISTHTLTWSVTVWAGNKRLFQRYFNSHAHVERDQIG